MSKEFEATSPWAILPAKVRYDASLPPNAKLLFAEIAAKTNIYGYCFASNAFFGGLFHLSEDTVRRLLNDLEAAGYISIEVDRAQRNDSRRKIYVLALAFAFLDELEQGPRKNAGTVPAKMPGTLCKINNKNSTLVEEDQNTEVQRPKTMPMDVFQAIADYCGNDGVLFKAFVDWAATRQRIRKPIATVETVRRACKKMEGLSQGDRAYKLGLLAKAADRCWTGLFPLQEGDEGFPTERNHRNYDPLGGLPRL